MSSFEIGYVTCGWYYGGINIRGSGVGHPKDPIGGLKGDSPGRFPLSELPLGESLGCPPSNGWWLKPLGIWVSKLVIICIVVGTDTIIGCWTG